jgi:hypothetical protein
MSPQDSSRAQLLATCRLLMRPLLKVSDRAVLMPTMVILLSEQLAFRFSEKLINEMTSDTIEQDLSRLPATTPYEIDE